MKVLFFEDINVYYNRVCSFLIKQEAENNLLFSILNTIKMNPTRYGEDKPFLIIVKENNEIKLMSLRTPPYNQVLSYTEDFKSIDFLADILIQKSMKLPDVVGIKNGAMRFTKLWCKKENLKYQIIRNERVYKLEKLAEDTLGNREFFIANESNQSLILNWTRNFMLEALAETSGKF